MFSIGQRWYSQAEPELGLGIVESVADRQVALSFAAAGEKRNYNSKSAPLKRHILSVGDQLVQEDGESFTVEEVQEQNGIVFYMGEGKVAPEMLLKSDISLVRPDERLLSGNFDSNELFNFRYQSTLLKRSLQTYHARGLEGSRIALIGHQVSIFADVENKLFPKLVLADEVGLGKTIEAGTLAKRLIERKLAKNVLVIAPKTLQYQWFVELYKKFDLLFKTLGAGSQNESDDGNDQGDEIELTSKVDNDDFIIANMPNLLESEHSSQVALGKEWDLLIVDEAHRYKKGSQEFELLEKLASASKSALFLSATPEALGEENFFELVKMLNPQKYTSYEEFLKSEKFYQEQSPTGPLLERYNYERDAFRNRRKNLEKHQELFPKKTLNPIPLKIDKPSDRKVVEAKVNELLRLLEEKPDAKVFAIGKSRALALQVQKKILQQAQIKIAVFHGEQSLLERDRQAAYFADPEGARALISAESGSEGRNFEFASELFLLDFPTHPQLLLQRIGRLDRIGQKNDVTIHAPYVANSPEESLFRLYNEAFNLFERFPTGLIEFCEKRQGEIQKAIETGSPELVSKLAQEYAQFQETVESAKNRFLDAHSYKQENVDKMRQSIKDFHLSNSIQSYLEKAFNFVGVDVEELSEEVFYIKPSDNMLIPSYPNLPNEGFSYTASRERALQRDDLRFMNFESPIVQGTIELFTDGELGNATAVSVDGAFGENIFIEFIHKVEPKQVVYNDISRFFPITPVRVMLDASGQDVTAKYPKKQIDTLALALSETQAGQLSQGLPKQAVAQLAKKAKMVAIERSKKYKAKALEQIDQHFDKEIQKLANWGAENQFSAQEMLKLKTSKELLRSQVNNLGVDLDSVRLVLG